MIVSDLEQGSEEWRNARLSIPTASCFDRIITPSGGRSGQFYSYMGELLAEYITKEQQSDFMSDDMIRGHEMEPLARSVYEVVTKNKPDQVGIVYKDESKDRACSPDGLMEAKGLEIKSPKLANHIGYVIEGVIPKKYIPQVQGSMYITGFSEWDFVSYHPDYKPLIVTVSRDEKYISKLSKLMDEFCEMLEEKKAGVDSALF